MRFPNFVGGSNVAQSSNVDGQRTVNFYPEVNTIPGAKAASCLYPIPGLSDFGTASDGGRAIFSEEERLFSVQGAELDEWSSAGVKTARGAVTVDANPAQMACNGADQLLIASGGFGQLLNLATNVLTAVVTGITMCGMVDTFFLALDTATGTLKISAAGDGTTWDPTQIALRSAAPDPWVAMLVARREIYLFGNKTGEVWYNKGASPFPFAQRYGAFFETGIEAPWSLAPFGETLAWLGRSTRGSCQVFWMNGYAPMPISTPALESTIQGYRAAGTISDAIGWSYETLGHSFYVLEFPAVGKTWVFDRATMQWAERGKWDADAATYLAYRPRFHANHYDKDLVLDSQTGGLYSFSSTVYTDVGGSPLRRLRRLPHVTNEHQQIYLDYVELECDRGVGLAAGQGSDPQMMLSVSWDGAKTFGNERLAGLGVMGDYNSRIRWDRCGAGRDLVMDLSCTDPVPTKMCDLYVGLS